MFNGPFGDGVTKEMFLEINKEHIINFSALTIALGNKGLLTVEDMEKARAEAKQLVDQEWARKKEEAERKFDKEYPGVRVMLETISGKASPPSTAEQAARKVLEESLRHPTTPAKEAHEPADAAPREPSSKN